MKTGTESANVALVLTPRPAAGGAAIAVLRLRGGKVRDFLSRFFSKPVPPGKCVHGRLCDGDRLIDDPLVVIGEDESWADLSLHGGAWVVAAALDLARREGFEILDLSAPTPDEAMDEIASAFEREVIGHLPLAWTELAIRSLLDQPAAWRAALRGGLDATAMLRDRSLWWLLHPPLVAIMGEPNVGKSTLANQLFGQERSITADIPGTTRDWVGEMANIQGLAVMLVDTPGFGVATDPLEQAAIAASREKIGGSDLRICVLDGTRQPAEEIEPFDGLIVVNKTDRPAAWDFSGLPALAISARTGAGVDRLGQQIRGHFGVGDGPARACWWTDRQREILGRITQEPDAARELGLG